MLVLTRRMGEEIVISGNIRLSIVRIDGNNVRLGVVAPASVRVQRQEIRARQPPEGLRVVSTVMAGTRAKEKL